MNDDAITVYDLVGTPWRWGGRGRDGADCWGVVKMGLRHYGIDYDADWQIERRAPVIDALIRHEAEQWPWQLVDEALPGDVLVMGLNGASSHIGLMTDEGVLHATERLGAVIQPIKTLERMGYHVKGIYRWGA